MEFRNSFDSAFGVVKYDLYDKRNEMENEMMKRTWRMDSSIRGYIEAVLEDI